MRTVAKLFLILALLILMVSCQKILGIEPEESEPRDRTEKWVAFDYITIKVTVLEAGTSTNAPVQNARVEVEYDDKTENVVSWDNNPISNHGYTNSQGWVTITVNNPVNINVMYKVGDRRTNDIFADKAVSVSGSHSGFQDGSTTAELEVEHDRTNAYHDEEYRYYAAFGSKTIYLASD